MIIIFIENNVYSSHVSILSIDSFNIQKSCARNYVLVSNKIDVNYLCQS